MSTEFKREERYLVFNHCNGYGSIAARVWDAMIAEAPTQGEDNGGF